jgi:hypothetical protein
MKKIRSIKQLKAEKNRIKLRQAELESKIRSNWKELKENLKPVNIVKDVLNRTIMGRTDDNLTGSGFVRNAITYGVTLLTNKFFNKLDDKFGKRFKQDSALKIN